MPFSGPGGVGEAHIRLEQVQPKRFVLLEGFRYTCSAGGPAFEITPEALGHTDLTSVPFAFRWFVNAYGRHTLPALLHDCLVDAEFARQVTVSGSGPPPDRGQADDVFLEALTHMQVPLIRRHLMWAAVSFNTRFTHAGVPGFILTCLWIAAAVAGISTFVVGLVWGPWWVSLLAAAGPIVASVLWASKWRAGLWFGYGAVFLLLAGVVIHATFAVYWVAESLLYRLGLTSAPPRWKEF